MAESSTIGMHPNLKAILITDRLGERNFRAPNFELENQMLRQLARDLASSPATILNNLVDRACEVCHAGSAGISLLESTNGKSHFRWRAVTGAVKEHLYATVEKDFSPCGIVLDQGKAQLFRDPSQYFTFIQDFGILMHELLLIPFFREEKMVGTIWVISHSPQKEFDAEDSRILHSLADFASAAVYSQQQLEFCHVSLKSLEADQTLHRRVQEELNLALESAQMGTWHVDLRTNHLTLSDGTAAIFGISNTNGNVFEMISQVVHPDDREELNRVWQTSVKSNTPYAHEYRIIRSDNGRVRWIFARGTTNLDDHGVPTFFSGVLGDFTDRKESERQLALERHKFESLFRESPAAMVLWRGADMVFEKVNPEFEKIFRGRAILGKPFLEGLPEFKNQPFLDLISKVFETGVSYVGREELAQIAAPNNGPLEDHYYDFTFSRIDTPEGVPYGVYDHSVDVTERVHARKKLEESEARFRNLANSLPQLAWAANIDGSIFWCNARFIQYTGMTVDDLNNQDRQSLCDPAHADRVLTFIRDAWKNQKPWEVTVPLRRQDGVYRWFLIRAVPIFNEEGLLTQWFGTNTDINEQLQLQEELVRANSELARFAFVASHDLKEPLRTVSTYSQLLQKQYRSQLDDTADLYIRHITQGVSRMYELINDLLSYSRVGNTKPKLASVDLRDIYEASLENLDSSIRESGAEITSDDLPTLDVDASQLMQLFQNLIANSIKYQSKHAPKIWVRAKERSDDWLFSVEDNGIGIASEYFEKIFVVFQRLHSRDEYSGTGIGLAVCKRIIENHAGKIWVESQVDRGSQFFFTLPKRRPAP